MAKRNACAWHSFSASLFDVKWNPQRICVRSKNAQPYLKTFPAQNVQMSSKSHVLINHYSKQPWVFMCKGLGTSRSKGLDDSVFDCFMTFFLTRI